MKTRYKPKTFLISITPLLPLVVLSCSNSNTQPNNQNSSFQQKIDELFKNNQITLGWNAIITKKIFDKYKTKFIELKKALNFTNKTSMNLNYEIIKVLEDQPTHIKLKIEINDNEGNKAIREIELPIGDQKQYVNSIFTSLKNEVRIKTEYQSMKLIDMFNAAQDLDIFVRNYLYVPEFLGVKIRVIIPSQVINFERKFKINFQVFDEDDIKFEKPLPPTIQIHQNYLQINKNQINLISLLRQSDINNPNDFVIRDIINRNNSLGKVFIFKDEAKKNININNDFGSKSIIMDLDFSQFDHIIFGPSSSFYNNKISTIKFNPKSRIENLKSNLFSQNKIDFVNLPQEVKNFNIGSFDPNVKIYGINSIDLITKIYDNQNNDLHLEQAKDANEVIEVLNIIKRVQARNSLVINKIFLPNFAFSYNGLITCNQVVFNSEFNKANPNEFFLNDLSKWTINKGINIPDSVVSISKNKLPSSATITRTINPKIKFSIKANKLDLSQQIQLDNNLSFTWFDKLRELDNWFFTFSSKDPDIDNISEIIVKNLDWSKIWNNFDFSNSISFFTRTNLSQKKVIIDAKFWQIQDPTQFYLLARNLKSSNILLERQIDPSFNFIINNELNVLQFYNFLDAKNITNNLSRYLVGLVFNKINLENITEIKHSLFQNLEFNNLTIDLSNIKMVRANGFSNAKGLVYTANTFAPTLVENFAFNNQQLNSSINLSLATFIGQNAFYNSNIIGDVNLSQASSIGSSAFYGNQNLTSVIFSNQLKRIQSSTFYNCGITALDLKQIDTIDSYAFYGNKISGELKLSLVKTIGQNAFAANSQISSVTGFPFINFYGPSSVFSNISSITFKNINNLNSIVGYNEQTRILDWSEKVVDNEFLNYVELFFSTKRTNFKEVILPKTVTINPKLINFVKKAESIEKLSWHANTKQMDFVLSNRLNIRSLDEGFVTGMNSVPANAFSNMKLTNTQLNLMNVEEINYKAFYKCGIKNFINVEKTVKVIAENAFDSNANLTLGTNVKLHKRAFSLDGQLPATVSRPKIFIGTLSNIYDEKTKILDFTKTQPAIDGDYDSEKNWLKYKNIGDYLMYGDVKKIVLPPLYILRQGFVDNLGDVEEIEFQIQNQQIHLGTFLNTNIVKKPTISETNILYDGDHFFVKN